MDSVNRILVVSRMTKYCRRAVRSGISLAKKYDADLYVVHVMHNPFGYEGWNLPIASLTEDYDKLKEKTKEDLHSIISSEKAKGLNVKEIIREGEPAKEILALEPPLLFPRS